LNTKVKKAASKRPPVRGGPLVVVVKTTPGHTFTHRMFEIKLPDGKIVKGRTIKLATYHQMGDYIYITISIEGLDECLHKGKK
jgi:hypothetical protein